MFYTQFRISNFQFRISNFHYSNALMFYFHTSIPRYIVTHQPPRFPDSALHVQKRSVAQSPPPHITPRRRVPMTPFDNAQGRQDPGVDPKAKIQGLRLRATRLPRPPRLCLGGLAMTFILFLDVTVSPLPRFYPSSALALRLRAFYRHPG